MRSRVIALRAVKGRAPKRATVRSIPRRRASDGEPPTDVLVTWPSSSRANATSALPADPSRTVLHAGSALAAWGKPRVKLVARSVAERTPTAPKSGRGAAAVADEPVREGR